MLRSVSPECGSWKRRPIGGKLRRERHRGSPTRLAGARWLVIMAGSRTLANSFGASVQTSPQIATSKLIKSIAVLRGSSDWRTRIERIKECACSANGSRAMEVVMHLTKGRQGA